MLSGSYAFLLYGGAIRGGKSVVALGLVIVLARIFPGSRWAIVRKDLPTLKRNTIPTFESIRPTDFVGEINRTDWRASCTNGSEILFFPESVKEDPELNRWRGLEVNGFALEEMNELHESSFSKAIERAGTWRASGEQPHPLVIGTCNPSRGYVKRMFYDPWKAGTLRPPFYFLPATIADNPHLDPAYIASLETLKKSDPRAYARFVRGDWETSDDPTQLIQFEWLLAARDVEPDNGAKALGVDVARYGDDDSVVAHRQGNCVTRLDYFHGLSTTRFASIVQGMINAGPIAADRVFVDVVGLGAGVVDSLADAGYRVVEVISGAKAEPSESLFAFADRRSQLWWRAREMLRLGEISIDVEDPRLLEDLGAPRYSVSAGKVIKVESKDEIRKRIGRSTDAGDAFVYAFADDTAHVAALDLGAATGGGKWRV